MSLHGDTATTCSIVSSLLFKSENDEAGLNSNLSSPWPEEGSRQLTGRLAIGIRPTSRNKTNYFLKV